MAARCLVSRFHTHVQRGKFFFLDNQPKNSCFIYYTNHWFNRVISVQQSVVQHLERNKHYKSLNFLFGSGLPVM